MSPKAKQLGEQAAYPEPDYSESVVRHGSEILDHFSYGGLTKREAFAMAAMQGCIASAVGDVDYKLAAKFSASMADALLEELAKEVA